MNPKTPLIVCIAAAGALFTSCAGVPLAREKLTHPAALLFNGYAKPEVACYRCHNGDGKGTMRGPNLEKKVPESTEQKLAEAIRDGKSFMPGFKDKLSEDEVTQLVTWLRAAFPAPRAP